MRIRPWHAFPFVAALMLVGREFRIAGTEDFLWYSASTVVLGAVVSGVFWLIDRKPLQSADNLKEEDCRSIEASSVQQNIVAKTKVITELPTEPFWERSLVEMQGNDRKNGLWAKSLAGSDGDETKAQAAYLQERVTQLQIEEENAAAAQRQQIEMERAAHATAARTNLVQIESIKSAFVSGKKPTKTEVEKLANASIQDRTILELSDRIYGHSVLHWSSRLELVGATKNLLRNGANPNAPNGQGRRPFQDSSSEFLAEINHSHKEA